MKRLIIVLAILVFILGVFADGILDSVFSRKKSSKNVCNKWKQCCKKCKGRQGQHRGLVITGGDNPGRIGSSELISSMGVCVSPNANIPDLPEAIAGGKSVWIEDSKTLMFCGGSNTYVGKAPNSPPWGALDTCHKVRPWLPGQDDWLSDSTYNMNLKRSWFTLTSIDKDLAMAVGGMTDDGDLLKSIEIYSKGRWRLLNKKLDDGRYGHCAVHYTKGKNDFLMIIGGSLDKDKFYNATDKVIKINLRTGKTSSGPTGLPALWAPACTTDGKYIYVSGGGNNGHAFSEVYRYSLAAGGPFTVHGGGLNGKRSGHTMGVSSEGQLIVAGGYNPSAILGSEYLKQIESSDDGGKTWNAWSNGLSVGGEYAAMASTPAFAVQCQG